MSCDYYVLCLDCKEYARLGNCSPIYRYQSWDDVIEKFRNWFVKGDGTHPWNERIFGAVNLAAFLFHHSEHRIKLCAFDGWWGITHYDEEYTEVNQDQDWEGTLLSRELPRRHWESKDDK